MCEKPNGSMYPANEALSVKKIKAALDERYRACNIKVYPVLDSTNGEAKRLASTGAGETLVVFSERQTMGRGRLGRSFFSPSGCGIYMSVLFHPMPDVAENAVYVTTAASVAVCRAIQAVTKEKPEIKWVNDIYVRGRKICGILTEAVSDPDTGKIGSVIVGIGINCIMPSGGFPEEIRKTAGTLFLGEKRVSRNLLAAQILNELFALYENPENRDWMDEYRRRSCVLDRDVRFLYENQWTNGRATDIDDYGGLVVRLENGNFVTLRTGEITLRLREEKDRFEKNLPEEGMVKNDGRIV